MTSKQGLVKEYKEILRDCLATKPSGLKKRIANAIGSNSSFVSQITNPNYRVPIPSHTVHKIMDTCHFTAAERTAFVKAYLLAHPDQSELITERTVSAGNHMFSIDLSRINDATARNIIKQALKDQAEAFIEISAAKTEP